MMGDPDSVRQRALSATGLAAAWRHAKPRRLLAYVLISLALTGSVVAQTPADNGAVMVTYHRFGEDSYPSTNIRLDQFERHIDILTNGDFNVLPLSVVIAAFKEGTPLPDRTVVITIDDAYQSVYQEAWPRMSEAGLPFTVFVATDMVGGGPTMMTWDEIRELAASGVEIGAHSAAHGHMPFMDRGAVEADFVRMTAALNEELGFVPSIYAYPYGEYSPELIDVVAAAGYDAALGQHSGVAYEGDNLFTLPRFALNERYGEPERFDLIVEALPLPVSDIWPSGMLIAENLGENNPPQIGFTVDESVGSLDQLNCFASNESDVALEILGADHVEVRLSSPFPPGRSRLNCTLPGPDGRWRWMGLPFLLPGGTD